MISATQWVALIYYTLTVCFVVWILMFSYMWKMRNHAYILLWQFYRFLHYVVGIQWAHTTRQVGEGECGSRYLYGVGVVRWEAGGTRPGPEQSVNGGFSTVGEMKGMYGMF